MWILNSNSLEKITFKTYTWDQGFRCVLEILTVTIVNDLILLELKNNRLFREI